MMQLVEWEYIAGRRIASSGFWRSRRPEACIARATRLDHGGTLSARQGMRFASDALL
jgi:hypothetical protein